MKNIVINCSVIFLTIAIIMNQAYPQTIHHFTRTQIRTSKITMPDNKWEMTINSQRGYINRMNIKVVRAFLKDFKEVEKVVWNKTNYGGYIAKFLTDSVQTTIKYNRSGSWNYIFRLYDENRMPANIREVVKDNFFDFDIVKVKEIKLPQENIIYSVIIKKADEYKVLKIFNDGIEIYSEFTIQKD